MSHRLFLTTQGRAKIATAASTAQGIRLTDFVIGSGRDVDFAARLDKNTLVAKRYQGKIASITAVSGVLGQYEIDCVVPQDIGGFAIREFGLLDDAGALVYVGTLPEVVKPDASSIAALDYRIKAIVQIDNPLVSIVIDANVVTATRAWVESHFIPRSALELLYPLGYKYWSHTPDSPKAGFDALFGYETFWRRLKGVQLVGVDEQDRYINEPMLLLGQKGSTTLAKTTRPHAYPLYTSYLWERYDPSSIVATVWRINANKQAVNEGDSLRFSISVNNVPDGVAVPWTIKEGVLAGGVITDVDNQTQGVAYIDNGGAVIDYTTTAFDNQEEAQKHVQLSLSAPANISLEVPISDRGHVETVIRIDQTTHDGIVLDELFKSMMGSYAPSGEQVRFVIADGVDIIAPSTTKAAIESGTNWSNNTIIIDNYGRILGRGGNGGRSAYWQDIMAGSAMNDRDTAFTQAQAGGNGGTAIFASVALVVNNYNLIAGGGGGGGGMGMLSSKGYNRAIGGGGAGGGAPFGLASLNEGTYSMYSIDPKAPTNKAPLPNAQEKRHTLYITTSEARYVNTVGGLGAVYLDSQYFAANNSQERVVLFEYKADSNELRQPSDSDPYYRLVMATLGSFTPTLKQATNATADTAGTGGYGGSISTGWTDNLLGTDNMFSYADRLPSNHGGDGGNLGENGQDGIIGDTLGTIISSYSIQRDSAKGGLAGYVYQGNVTINNISSGITKGR